MELPHHHPEVVVPGDKVFLGPIRKELIQTYRRWVNDLVVAHSLGPLGRMRIPLTQEDEVDWYEAVRKDPSQVIFTVFERLDDRPVGNVSLGGIDHQSGSAELGVLIGERSVWGRGYATEAIRLILDYGFTLLGLHHIWLKYAAFNDRARGAYERAGFREAGRLREAWRVGSRRFDVVLMDILASEFTSPVLARLVALPDSPASEAGAREGPPGEGSADTEAGDSSDAESSA